VIPVGFIVFLIGSGVMLLQRGEKIISMFAFASTVFCFFWLRRDAGTAVKMLLKKNAYK
jgi:hypothetical protein